MTRLFRALIAASTVALLATGCASGPAYKDVASSIPTLKESQGRIYFYRSNSVIGVALQPHVYVNDQPVGKSKPGGFFYIDRPAGDYIVSTRTEAKKTLSLHLDAGETKYVKTTVTAGFGVGRVTPTLESADDATKELEGLHFIGEAATTAAE